MWMEQLKSLKGCIFKHLCSMASISCSLNSVCGPPWLLYYNEPGGSSYGILGCIIDMTASSQTFLGLFGPARIIGPLTQIKDA